MEMLHYSFVLNKSKKNINSNGRATKKTVYNTQQANINKQHRGKKHHPNEIEYAIYSETFVIVA